MNIQNARLARAAETALRNHNYAAAVRLRGARRTIAPNDAQLCSFMDMRPVSQANRSFRSMPITMDCTPTRRRSKVCRPGPDVQCRRAQGGSGVPSEPESCPPTRSAPVTHSSWRNPFCNRENMIGPPTIESRGTHASRRAFRVFCSHIAYQRKQQWDEANRFLEWPALAQ